jgi:hypothetical protein
MEVWKELLYYVIYIYTHTLFITLGDGPSPRPTNRSTDRLPLCARSRSTPHELKRPRASRLTRLSHFSYRAQSFYDFVSHSAKVISGILATVLIHSYYSGQPF